MLNTSSSIRKRSCPQPAECQQINAFPFVELLDRIDQAYVCRRIQIFCLFYVKQSSQTLFFSEQSVDHRWLRLLGLCQSQQLPAWTAPGFAHRIPGSVSHRHEILDLPREFEPARVSDLQQRPCFRQCAPKLFDCGGHLFSLCNSSSISAVVSWRQYPLIARIELSCRSWLWVAQASVISVTR